MLPTKMIRLVILCLASYLILIIFQNNRSCFILMKFPFAQRSNPKPALHWKCYSSGQGSIRLISHAGRQDIVGWTHNVMSVGQFGVQMSQGHIYLNKKQRHKFQFVHLIKLKDSSMTGPTAAMGGGDLYIKLIEVSLVMVPRQKLIKIDTATWKYYSC